MLSVKKLKAHLAAKVAHRKWVKERNNALVRASNGEHLTLRERVYYQLPDWTA